MKIFPSLDASEATTSTVLTLPPAPIAPAAPADGLSRIAFFGRTRADYEAFFGFSTEGWKGRTVLDVGAGTASFAAEAVRAGLEVIAVDPVYRLRLPAVRDRARADFEANRRLVAAHPERFAMATYGSEEAFWKRRQAAQDGFLADFEAGVATGRYRAGALPQLEFADDSFDVVLCGHFLFLYGEYFSREFHRAALLELLRVARQEVRVYPLRTLRGEPYPELDALLRTLFPYATSRRERVENTVFRGADERLVLVPRR